MTKICAYFVSQGFVVERNAVHTRTQIHTYIPLHPSFFCTVTFTGSGALNVLSWGCNSASLIV